MHMCVCVCGGVVSSFSIYGWLISSKQVRVEKAIHQRRSSNELFMFWFLSVFPVSLVLLSHLLMMYWPLHLTVVMSVCVS